jgi:branched-subunit amino acid ABC-type transport system permease component
MEPVNLIIQLITGISSGMILFLMASGASLIVSGMNIINFGQGAFFMLGAYMCFTLVHVFNFWWALILGPLVVAGVGGLAELLLRPLYGKSILYQLLLTMGVAFAIVDSMNTIWGRTIKVVPLPSYLNSTTPFLGLDFPTYYIFIIAISGLIAIGLWLMFEKTKLGMIFRAIISDRVMVGNLGINVSLLFSVMFMCGVWLSGVGGALMAPIIGIQAETSMDFLFTMMIVLVIGGLKSMRGAFSAALIVGIVNAFGSLLLPWFYALIPAVLMIIVLLIKPQGLFGKPGE